MKVETFTIPATKEAIDISHEPADGFLQLEHTYRVEHTQRGNTALETIDISGGKMAEFIFSDGTVWLSDAATINSIFTPAANADNRSGAASVPALPLSLAGGSNERGFAGDVLLKIVNIFSKKPSAKTPGQLMRTLAARLEKSLLDNRSGLFSIDENFTLQSFDQKVSNRPFLLLIHGTASSTESSFDELKKQNSATWKYMKEQYGSNILALHHETLTKSPLQNVLDLVTALPATAALHLVTHSRGGLVGELLCRFCNGNAASRGFTQDEKDYLRKTGHEQDVKDIAAIEKVLAAKSISVENFVRVACPAAGTILASKRLDNLFNILLNLLGAVTGSMSAPLFNTFKSLAAAAIDCKNDVSVLPGLEAMNPESPFIKVLNNLSTQHRIDSPLVIIAGNCQVSFGLKGLLIIAERLFFWQDNDLVVNTESMYHGTRRILPVQYYLHEQKETDHFSYFKNKPTSEALQMALQTTPGELVAGFSQLEQAAGETDRAGLLGLEYGSVFEDTVTGTRPVVLLLPGIMGSNLSKDGKEYWIDYWRMLNGKLTELHIKAQGITATSLVGTSYKKLVRFLQKEKYDVVTFPFDWRQPLTTTARLLNEKIKSLLNHKQPLKIIGHSMGGVLMRDFILAHTDTWKELNDAEGFRLLFLGAPLGGSFRIPAVFFGMDSIIEKLAKLDRKHDKKELLELFSEMPGLYSLLPLTTDDKNNFANSDTWKKMAAAMMDSAWPVVQHTGINPLLTQFEQYRQQVLKHWDKTDGSSDIHYGNMTYIAGLDLSEGTPDGYTISPMPGDDGLFFTTTPEGDGSVTWESGIPSNLKAQQAVYFADVIHGELANAEELFRPIAEILARGGTGLLSKTKPDVKMRSGTVSYLRNTDLFDVSEAGVYRTLMGLAGKRAKSKKGTEVIEVTVSNGDLKYAAYPVMVGHFEGDGLLSAEKVINLYLDEAPAQRLQLGLYPGPIGTSELILSRKEGFKGAIVVGLGNFGDLTAFRLTQTIEQAVTNYLLHCNTETAANTTVKAGDRLGISSLLIGSGYGGLMLENAVNALIEGVRNANEKMKAVHGAGTRIIQHIEFIELYKDRALGCLYAIKKTETRENTRLSITTAKKAVKKLLGSWERLPLETTDEWWNRISVKLNKEKSPGPGIRCLEFSASTGVAREQLQTLYNREGVVEEILEKISASNKWSPELAKTIFELLIPNDFKEHIKKQGHINWIVDVNTAFYPWELLQDNPGFSRPLSINAGMIRQLATEDYRKIVRTVSLNKVLIIADPLITGSGLPQLKGAENEGKLVNQMFTDNNYKDIVYLPQRTASEIIINFFCNDYKIIHLAGHGLFNKEVLEGSGMVIGSDTYLTAYEINQMGTVPELVFINCCFLGQIDGAAEAYTQSRFKMAANIGTQLIKNGVKAVVAAGWAVNDTAALLFCEVFYEKMFAGYNFGDAVLSARKQVYEAFGSVNNTWGAYQCYGDPFYRLNNNSIKPGRKEMRRYLMAEEAEIDLSNLQSDLKTGRYSNGWYKEKLAAITAAIDKAGIRNTSIIEKEAFIYTDLYEYDKAIEKFEALFESGDTSFSVQALENYYNVQTRKLVYDFEELERAKEKTGKTPSKKERSNFSKAIDGLIDKFISMCNLRATAERYSMLASAYKRKARMLETQQEKIATYTAAYKCYAEALEKNPGNREAYIYSNMMEVAGVLVLTGHAKWGDSIKGSKIVLPAASAVSKKLELDNSLLNGADRDMQYWEMVDKANTELCKLFIQPPAAKDKKAWDAVQKAYADAWKQLGARGKKKAIIENLTMLEDILKSNQDVVKSAFYTAFKNLILELEKLT